MPSILEDFRIDHAAGSRSPFPYHRQSSPSTSSISSGNSSSSFDYDEKRPFLAAPHNSSPFNNSLIEDDCMVITTADQATQLEDPMYRKPWRQFVSRFFFITALIPCILSVWALGVQVRILRYSNLMDDFHVLKRWMIYTFMSIDVIWTADQIFNVFTKLPTMWAKRRPRLRLVGDNVPPVDIILPVCNEKLDIIQDTVRATLNIDYPRHRFRVMVSDDGANPKLQAWVESLAEAQGERNINLFYTARVKTGSAGYKAGNLNHAMRVIDAMPGGSAEFVAGLDADMIPNRDWLRAVAAHIVRDSKLAMVCPTQLFYNTPEHDPLYQTSGINWQCLDMLRDHAGAGWNLGSGWIIRRLAVDDIGGFPTDCLVEDVCSSMIMLAHGWKTAYIPEGLQYGLVPETYIAHVKQMTRWYMGGAQMALRFRGYLSRTYAGKMAPMVRLLGLSNGLAIHLRVQFGTLSHIITPLFMASAMPLVFWTSHAEMVLLLRLNAAVAIAGWIHDCHVAILAGYRNVMMDACMSKYLSPYFSIAWFRSFILPASLGGKVTGFTATGSISNNLHERSASRRAPLAARIRHALVDGGMWMHVLIIASLMGAALFRCYQIFSPAWRQQHEGDNMKPVITQAMWIELLQTVAWPSKPLFPTILACLTPLHYALFPPDVPDRNKLMGKPGKNGARYPRPETRKDRTIKGLRFEYAQLQNLIVLYAAVLFIWSWRI